jgi:hypothetical protein
MVFVGEGQRVEIEHLDETIFDTLSLTLMNPTDDEHLVWIG